MFSRTFLESVHPEVLQAVDRVFRRLQLREASVDPLTGPSGASMVMPQLSQDLPPRAGRKPQYDNGDTWQPGSGGALSTIFQHGQAATHAIQGAVASAAERVTGFSSLLGGNAPTDTVSNFSHANTDIRGQVPTMMSSGPMAGHQHGDKGPSNALGAGLSYLMGRK